jgi:hypothetical protein
MRNKVPQTANLQSELQMFRQCKQEWLKGHEGEFVVISDQTVAGFYPDYESGLRAGLKKFGLRSFLIKQVLAEEPVYHIY